MIEQQKLGPYKEGKEHLHQNMLQAKSIIWETSITQKS